MIFGFTVANGLVFNILFFIVGLVLLIKGGDWFVDGSSNIARVFKIPEIIVGATIVSIGTTLPEVLVSTTSAIKGYGDIAYGNAIGSIICNTALISAITISITPSKVDRKALKGPIIFFYGAAIFYIVLAFTGSFPRWSGILLLAIFVLYLVYVSLTAKNNQEIDESSKGEIGEKKDGVGKSILLLVIGAAFIATGANLLVDNGQLIAAQVGVPQTVIALTFVALGTSLPELITAIISLKKGHGALSLGNIIGANLFNLVFVSGMSIAVSPFNVPTEKTLFGMNASFVVDIPVMLIVMSIMCIPTIITGKLKRWQGITLLAIYTLFCAFQFIG